MFDIFANPDAWVALLTLTFLEIVLGIDNIIFISIAVGKLEPGHQKKATNLGLVLAMVMRILLLFGISLLTSMKKPFWVFDSDWITGGISGQGIILFLGGLFLLYKSTKEIHEKEKTILITVICSMAFVNDVDLAFFTSRSSWPLSSTFS